MASVTAPRNASFTGTGATESHAGEPASTPPATRPTTPMSGATRSRTGGNSAAALSKRCSSRSMPVMAATRADRRSTVSRWPATPAAFRRTETTNAAVAASATPTAAPSRTGTGPIAWATSTEARAMAPNTPRMSQP